MKYLALSLILYAILVQAIPAEQTQILAENEKTAKLSQDIKLSAPTVPQEDWQARVEQKPGFRGLTLIVQGHVKVPNPGYEATLKKVKEQTDPKRLQLKVHYQAPEGDQVWPTVITPKKVDYREDNYGGDYQYVVIRVADEDRIKVEIEMLVVE